MAENDRFFVRPNKPIKEMTDEERGGFALELARSIKKLTATPAQRKAQAAAEADKDNGGM